MSNFRLIAYTQYRENYGAHGWDGKGECPQYWKSKGGNDIVVAELTLDQISALTVNGLEFALSFLIGAKQINHSDEYSQEWVLGWELFAPGEETEMERWLREDRERRYS